MYVLMPHACCKHCAYYAHMLSLWHDAGAHPTDVRMTTRFKEHDLTEGLTGAIHETGHSLYEQVWVMFLGFRVCSQGCVEWDFMPKYAAFCEIGHSLYEQVWVMFLGFRVLIQEINGCDFKPEHNWHRQEHSVR